MARLFVLAAVLLAAEGIAGCGPSGPRSTIICFGDSITAQGARRGGYVTLANEMFRKACPGIGSRIVAAGVSGSRMPDLERRVKAEVLAQQPRAVVVYIGINDVWHTERGGGTPRPEFEAGLRRLVANLQAADILVILCTPSVIGEKPAGLNPLDAMLDDFSDVIRMVAADTAAGLVDLRIVFQRHLHAHNLQAAREGILTYDGVHLNAAGNSLVARTLVEQLARILPCEPPGPMPTP